MIFIIVLLCPVSLFAQQTVPFEQFLKNQLDAVFWEANYCRQRIMVLQTKSEQIQEQIQALKIERQKELSKEKADK